MKTKIKKTTLYYSCWYNFITSINIHVLIFDETLPNVPSTGVEQLENTKDLED